jgi:uncharacterized protein (TIGR02246 family)
MNWRNVSLVLSFVFLFSLIGRLESTPESEIREKVKQYQESFNRGDAKTLATFWAEDADYVQPETGEHLKGRQAIEEQFTDNFSEKPGLKIDIAVSSITFPKEDQAVENGVATVTQNGELIDKSAYKAFYVKKGSEWLLTQVREVDTEDAPSQYEHLKALDWLVGSWVDADEDSTIDSTYQWDKYKNFLTQHFTVQAEGIDEIEGKQIIAWDPVNEKIRSWLFDSDGGFGEGSWKQKEKSWVVETSHTLADGRKASSINIYTPIDQNSYTWQSVGREVGGEMLPDIDPVTVVRKKG